MKKTNYVFWVILMALLCLFVSVSVGIAELVHTDEGILITHYPETFDGQGAIDRIDRKGVVIDDVYFSFSGQVKFMLPRREYALLDNFKVGNQVGYLLNDKRQVTDICMLQRSGERKGKR